MEKILITDFAVWTSIDYYYLNDPPWLSFFVALEDAFFSHTMRKPLISTYAQWYQVEF